MTDYEIIKDLAKKIWKAGFSIVSYPFAIPTYMRKTNEADIKGNLGVFAYFFTFLGGPMFTLSIDAGLIKNYEISQNENFLIFPIATITGNILSGLYEWYRYEDNKKKKGFLPTNSPPASTPISTPVSTPIYQPNSLEKKVEEVKPEIKIEIPVPKQIPNPWDIHIDEIENLSYNKLEKYVGVNSSWTATQLIFKKKELQL